MPKNQYKSVKKAPFSLKTIQITDIVIGVDEAGRGAWAGPVVAACVLWGGKNPVKNTLRDSKKMTERERAVTYDEIVMLAEQWQLAYWVGVVSHEIIDTVGIREANRLAMQEALWNIEKETLKKKKKNMFLLVDGRDNYSFDIPWLSEPEYIVRGDSKVKQIMAASILAKVTRDRIMTEYASDFPSYGFETHKWYGTHFHQEAIKHRGIASIHRKSYKPIKLASSWKGL